MKPRTRSSFVLVASCVFVLARLAVANGLGGGGHPNSSLGRADISADDLARIAEQFAEYERRFGSLSRGSQRDAPPLFPFYPMGGTLYGDLFINNFVDLDPGPGLLDWDCTDFTYNGHDASDVDLRGFGEQQIGVPVFAALDGTVVATHDGEFDMNVCPGSPCNPNANYVIIDHGDGRLCYYWHLKLWSVAVSPGEQVVAGQQIGLAASSGNSSQPHLHFATYDDGIVFEPWAGDCRAGQSGWVNQVPIERSLYLRDFGVTYEDMHSYPGFPYEFPRSGQLSLDDPYVYFWALPINLPASSTWRVRFQRPNGTIAYDSGHVGFQGGNNPFYRWSWWWWDYDITDMHSITGTWHIQLYINGDLLIAAPVEVREERTPDFNRPPEPISVNMEPTQPTTTDPIVCRVSTSLTLDDLDYDIVSYHYHWDVNGYPVRDIVTAAHADMLRCDAACAGDIVACAVTPQDGMAEGPPASSSLTVFGDWQPGDLDFDAYVDVDDLILFTACMTGPDAGVPPCCRPGDADADGDIDLRDYGLIQLTLR